MHTVSTLRVLREVRNLRLGYVPRMAFSMRLHFWRRCILISALSIHEKTWHMPVAVVTDAAGLHLSFMRIESSGKEATDASGAVVSANLIAIYTYHTQLPYQ
jgi:hypothetical protein